MQGFYGAIIANMLLIVLLYFSRMEIPDLAEIQDHNMILTLMAGVVITGIFISGISTYFAVNKYLSRQNQELY